MPGVIFPSLRWRPTLYIGVIGFVLFACVALIVADISYTIGTRRIVLKQAETSTLNLAQSLSVQAEDTFERAGAVLTGFKERVETYGIGPQQLEHLRHVILLHLKAQPILHNVLVVDESGNGVVNAMQTSGPPLNYSDRDYFVFHKTHADDTAMVSGPLRSKLDGSWIFVVSRRFNKPDGTFGGLVIATISLSQFQKFYETLDVGQGGIITLSSIDGQIVIRTPYDERFVGRRVTLPQRFRAGLEHASNGSFEYVSLLDGITRIGSFVRLEHFPFLVIVGQSKNVALLHWEREARTHFVLTGVTVLIIAAMGLWLARQVRDRQRAEALYRLLADNSSDAIIRTIGRTGQFRFLSPAYYTMTGFLPGTLVGKSWRQQVHPDDVAVIEARLQGLQHDVDKLDFTYRQKCADNSYIWCETRLKMIPSTASTEMEYIANIRDVSARKLVEEKLALAREELVALSLTDALTGISNRRKFDDTLVAEWRRGVRDRTPLSLLLIDIDHFKKYNDRYGHQKGDACLKQIAQMVAASITRSTDLVARYGGEEFAVILPDTPAASAVIVAERIRMAILQLAIQHLASPQMIATISIGIATDVPQLGKAAAELVSDADIALYQAKSSGRNQHRCFQEPKSQSPNMISLGNRAAIS